MKRTLSLFIIGTLFFVNCALAQSDGYNGNGFQARPRLSTEDAAAMGLYKVSLTDDFIELMMVSKVYYPRYYFDRIVTENCLSAVTGWYMADNCPLDSTWSSEKKRADRERKAKGYFEGVNLDEYDKEFVQKFRQNERFTQMKRGDFWEELFEIDRSIANPVGFAVIEKSIRDIHSALGLDWNDSIYIEKNMLEKHRAVVESFFTEQKDSINPRYIR